MVMEKLPSKMETERGEDQKEMQATMIIEQTEPIATERTVIVNMKEQLQVHKPAVEEEEEGVPIKVEMI